MGGTIRIFYDDSLLAGITATQHNDNLVGAQKLGHPLCSVIRVLSRDWGLLFELDQGLSAILIG